MNGLMKSRFSNLVRILIPFMFVFCAGCAYQENILSLDAPAEVSIAKETQEPEPTVAEVQTSVPTWQPVSDGLIRLPVTGAEKRTADDLNEADRPEVNRSHLSQELIGMVSGQLEPKTENGSEYLINDRLDYIVNNPLTGDTRIQPARLRYISENAFWWKSITAQVADEQVQAVAQNFEEQIVLINEGIFGGELLESVDHKPWIHILMIEEPSWEEAVHYFNGASEYPGVIEPLSNRKDMILVNLEKVVIDSGIFSGELAYAYSQLILWNQDPNEDFWLKEAISELALFLIGAPPKGNNLAVSNAELFAENPSIQLTARPGRGGIESNELFFAHHAAERLFAIYLLEQFGPQLIANIVNNPAPGVLGIHTELAKLPGAPRFEDVYSSWIIANLINRTSMGDGKYGYKGIRPASPFLELVDSLDGEQLVGSLPPYGTRYYEVRPQGPVQINFTGSTLARLTPADPASGRYSWYSNRGDETEFSLMRAFDLSELDAATLNFKTWYQLEEFYDFAYVQVSVDGGSTWEILESEYGTQKDPNNLSLGVGYTGETPDWVLDSADLTPYCGQEIQLRFHVITDFTNNGYGFQVDDITIPELGYFDSAEDGLGGWEAKGFVRSSNFVPAEWIIWLVETSSPIRVERISPTQDQVANFEINALGDNFARAVIAISPTAPVTTMEIDYEINFQQH